MSSITYRPDIDGLRAVVVVADQFQPELLTLSVEEQSYLCTTSVFQRTDR